MDRAAGSSSACCHEGVCAQIAMWPYVYPAPDKKRAPGFASHQFGCHRAGRVFRIGAFVTALGEDPWFHGAVVVHQPAQARQVGAKSPALRHVEIQDVLGGPERIKQRVGSDASAGVSDVGAGMKGDQLLCGIGVPDTVGHGAMDGAFVVNRGVAAEDPDKVVPSAIAGSEKTSIGFCLLLVDDRVAGRDQALLQMGNSATTMPRWSA